MLIQQGKRNNRLHSASPLTESDQFFQRRPLTFVNPSSSTSSLRSAEMGQKKNEHASFATAKGMAAMLIKTHVCDLAHDSSEGVPLCPCPLEGRGRRRRDQRVDHDGAVDHVPFLGHGHLEDGQLEFADRLSNWIRLRELVARGESLCHDHRRHPYASPLGAFRGHHGTRGVPVPLPQPFSKDHAGWQNRGRFAPAHACPVHHPGHLDACRAAHPENDRAALLPLSNWMALARVVGTHHVHAFRRHHDHGRDHDDLHRHSQGGTSTCHCGCGI